MEFNNPLIFFIPLTIVIGGAIGLGGYLYGEMGVIVAGLILAAIWAVAYVWYYSVEMSNDCRRIREYREKHNLYAQDDN